MPNYYVYLSIVLITSFVTWLLTFRHIQGHFPRMRNNQKTFALEGESEVFSIEAFQVITKKHCFLSAVLHFEREFKTEAGFNSFHVTRLELRQIACAECKGLGTQQIPRYLRQRAVKVIAMSVTSLEEACSEYKLLRSAISIDENQDLYKMVNKFILTQEDCSSVIEKFGDDYILGYLTFEGKKLKTIKSDKSIFGKEIIHETVVQVN
jgi:hypothetical protein